MNRLERRWSELKATAREHPRRLTRPMLAGLLAYVAVFHLLYIGFDGRPLVDHDPYFLSFNRLIPSPGGTTWRTVFLPTDLVYPFYFGVNLLLAGLTATVGMSQWLFRLVPLSFFWVLMLAAFLLGKTVGGRWGGLAAAAVVATWPHFVEMSRQNFATFPCGALLLCGYAGVVRMYTAPWRRALPIGVGAAIGAAGVVHPIGLPFGALALPFLTLAPWLGNPTVARRHAVRDVAFGLAAMVLVAAPALLTLSNYLKFKFPAAGGTDYTAAQTARELAAFLAMQGGWPARAAFVSLVVMAVWSLVRQPRWPTAVAWAIVALAVPVVFHLVGKQAFALNFSMAYALVLAVVAAGAVAWAAKRRLPGRLLFAVAISAFVISGAMRMQTSLNVLALDAPFAQWPENSRSYVIASRDHLTRVWCALRRIVPEGAIETNVYTMSRSPEGGIDIRPNSGTGGYVILLELTAAIHDRRLVFRDVEKGERAPLVLYGFITDASDFHATLPRARDAVRDTGATILAMVASDSGLEGAMMMGDRRRMATFLARPPQ